MFPAEAYLHKIFTYPIQQVVLDAGYFFFNYTQDMQDEQDFENFNALLKYILV